MPATANAAVTMLPMIETMMRLSRQSTRREYKRKLRAGKCRPPFRSTAAAR
jgi:hypothetical protein